MCEKYPAWQERTLVTAVSTFYKSRTFSSSRDRIIPCRKQGDVNTSVSIGSRKLNIADDGGWDPSDGLYSACTFRNFRKLLDIESSAFYCTKGDELRDLYPKSDWTARFTKGLHSVKFTCWRNIRRTAIDRTVGRVKLRKGYENTIVVVTERRTGSSDK
ncbi:hypothetical protein ARMGADRAFT_1035131 [Armillaria gallica]|uniref:Uncharacterized protein n=1 Tax=Armillaria gallica TaxID=47427 RepID=A0A2H3CZI8_ARMGA|nr:hypothetical protein ARMGADRAFT_1035131 [Armillaria gallica]